MEDVAKTFNLPHNFLIPAIEVRIGTIINGQLDPVSKVLDCILLFICRLALKTSVVTRLNLNHYLRIDTITHSIHFNLQDVLFTEAFITRNISKIRGIFTAITQPTSIAQLVATYNLPEKLFFSVLESLVASKRLSGKYLMYLF